MSSHPAASGPAFGFRSPEAAAFPEMVVCGICFRCNARCIHCPNAATGFTATLKGPDQLMSWDVLRRIADECALHPHCMIRVSSCGEILVHPEAVEMIEYMLRVKADRNVALTTNGALLTKDKAERLLAAGIRSIEFSVDAHRKDTYAKIRVGLDFDRMLRNIETLVELRDKMRSPTKVLASIVEQPDNTAEVDGIRRFWEARVDEVLLRRLLAFKGIIARSDKQPPQLEKNAPCPFLWERVLVDAAGDVRGCVSDIYNTSRLGSIREQTIADVWQSPLLNSWRRMHLEGRSQDAPPCRGCQDMEYRSWTYNYFTALAKERKTETSAPAPRPDAGISVDPGTIIAILQPGYLPWLGFFEQMDRAGVFVYLDDVQYTKADWRSRNRIRIPAEPGWAWLTVPVRAGPTGRLIREVKIDYQQKWVARHLNLIRANYCRAPFFDRFFPALRDILESKPELLMDLDVSLAGFLAESFGIHPRIKFSSGCAAPGRKTEKLLNICLAERAGTLYDGESSRNFMDEPLMQKHGIRVVYQIYHPPPYPQQSTPFIPFLSALDLLLNCGPAGLGVIRAGASPDKTGLLPAQDRRT